MKTKILIPTLLLMLLCSCDLEKTYYGSGNIYMKKCFKKNGIVFFDYQPTLESVYSSSGVDVKYSEDSSIANLRFIRQHSRMPKHKVDIKSILLPS